MRYRIQTFHPYPFKEREIDIVVTCKNKKDLNACVRGLSELTDNELLVSDYIEPQKTSLFRKIINFFNI